MLCSMRRALALLLLGAFALTPLQRAAVAGPAPCSTAAPAAFSAPPDHCPHEAASSGCADAWHCLTLPAAVVNLAEPVAASVPVRAAPPATATPLRGRSSAGPPTPPPDS